MSQLSRDQNALNWQTSNPTFLSIYLCVCVCAHARAYRDEIHGQSALVMCSLKNGASLGTRSHHLPKHLDVGVTPSQSPFPGFPQWSPPAFPSHRAGHEEGKGESSQRGCFPKGKTSPKAGRRAERRLELR